MIGKKIIIKKTLRYGLFNCRTGDIGEIMYVGNTGRIIFKIYKEDGLVVWLYEDEFEVIEDNYKLEVIMDQ